MATAKKTSKKATKKVAKSSAAKKGPAKTSAKNAPAKKSAASTVPAKKTAAKKTAAKKATANKTAAKKTAAKKATTNKTTAKKAPAKKSAASTVPAKKAPAERSTARVRTKTPVKKKPVKSPFGKKFVNEMKDRLVHERAKYLHSEQSYRADAEALIEGREPGDVQFDEESGEGDTVAVERERDLALSAQSRAAVEQIDAALGRIEVGTYGVCVTSGLAIPGERLRAIPWASERVEFKVGGLGRI